MIRLPKTIISAGSLTNQVILLSATEIGVRLMVGKEMRAIGWYLLTYAATQNDEQLAALYTKVLRAGREEIKAQRIERLEANVAACLKHVAIETKTSGFFGSVSLEENRAAHGNVTFKHRCPCGAMRYENVNGEHVETGEWFAPINDVTGEVER